MTKPAATLVELIQPHLAKKSDFPVLIFDHGSAGCEQRSYLELWQRGQSLAFALAEMDLKAGEHFALLMANHPEFVEALLAASLSGSVVVPIDVRMSGDKLVYFLNQAQCQGVIVADYALAGLLAVRAAVPQLRWIIVLGSQPDEQALAYERLMDKPVRDYPAYQHPDDSPMQLIFTSGTTGDPKAIVMTHQRFCATAQMAGAAFGYQSDDRLYSGLSLTHANAQLVTLGAALALGIPAVFSRRFSRSQLWDLCRKYGCTSFSLLGGMTVALYAQPARAEDRKHPVRRVISAGMPKALWSNFAQRFGVEILEFYGTAEGGLTINPPQLGPVGSIGKPPAALGVRIINEQGQECAAGEPGELCFYSKNATPLSLNYFNNLKASQAKCRDGVLHTGDIVSCDQQGWLYFHYRKGGGIRRNGEFISPAVIEQQLAKISEIDDLYVYGKPAASGVPGEKELIVAVVPCSTLFDVQCVFDCCHNNLPKSCWPDFVQVLVEIPKTASEKPQERFLLELFAKHPDSIFCDKINDSLTTRNDSVEAAL